MNNLVQDLTEDLKILKATRANILKLLSEFSLQQVNQVPEGLNNNLAWNAGHIWVTQKLLTYGLSGQETGLSAELIGAYKKGSKPGATISAEDWAVIIDGLTNSVDELEKDLVGLTWAEHKPYTTSYGVTIAHVSKGVRFNNTHEGMHLGTMIALSKLV
ncbi:MAG: DinB family protein [Saprospiraceae bacterium]